MQNTSTTQINQSEAWQRNKERIEFCMGKFSSSQMFKLMAQPKGTTAKDVAHFTETGRSYIKAKVAEILTSMPVDTLYNAAIQWGEANESEAIEKFEELYKKQVLPCAGYTYNEHAAGTPDGEVKGESAIVEVKCPYNSGIHIEHLTYESHFCIPNEYYIQMQTNMLFGQKQKCYFISYDPRMNRHLQLKVVEVPAEPVIQQRIKAKLANAIEIKQRILKNLSTGGYKTEIEETQNK